MKKTILIVLALLLLPLHVFAVATWEKPTFVHGGGLSEEQVEETSLLLGIKEDDDILISPVTGSDSENYIGKTIATSSMISSAFVVKEKKDSGIHVEIKTPENITAVTKEQYEGAAITAGVKDVTIFIAAPYAVTGHSALTGVYKAFELNGEDLSIGAMQLAQEEIDVMADITGESKDKEEFDGAKLAQAMVEIKEDIIAAIEKEGSITREEIQKIIEDTLKKLNLTNIISTVNIDKLVNYFVKFSNTEGLDFTQMKKQLEDLGKELAPKIKDLIKEAESSGFLDKLIKFFEELFQKLSTLFN